jgi:hypothetical protein
VVILRAPDIAVRNHGGGSGWTRQGLPVKVVFEDRFNTLVRTRTDADGAVAGRFKACIAIAFAQPHDAQTRTEALLGMRPCSQNRFNHLGRGLTCFRRPANKPLGRPFGIVLMGLGHVGRPRAVAKPRQNLRYISAEINWLYFCTSYFLIKTG